MTSPNPVQRLNAALAGRYRVVGAIGEGGMARVYLAEDLKHHREVALKVLRPELAAFLGADRFLREIEVTAGLQHPNILPLHDSGQADGLLYFVMPYVRGESLRERLDREGRRPVKEVVGVLSEVADALAYAHAQGVIHRDIKPSNVLVSAHGHAVVSDFGIARAARGAGGPTLETSAGISLGTPSYMAPEQAAGEAEVDHRADLYSLGAMGYELLAGRPPFQGGSLRSLLAAKLTRAPEPVEARRPDVPRALARIVMQCLATDPGDRFQTAADVVEALSSVRIAETTRGNGAPTSHPPGRRLALWGAVALATAAMLFAWPGSRSRDEASAEPRILAVVPLTTLGSDGSTEAFASGLAEVLASRLTELARFGESPFWVIPPNEIRELEITSAAGARKALKVTWVITGTLQALTDGLRLTLNLVEAETLRQVRSTVLSGRLSDLATWQDGAIEEALAMLDLQPQGAWSAAPVGGTRVGTAYELYLKARGYLQRSARTQTDLDTAAALFTQAVGEDSTYALAWAGLGEAHWYKYRETLDTQYVQLAISSSRRALRLADSLPEVWTALSVIDNGMGQWEGALANAGRALEIDSLYTDAYLELASAYRDLQQLDEAERVLRELIGRRPYHFRGYRSLGYLRYVQGRYEEAAELYDRAGGLAPGSAAISRDAGAIYFFLDRWEDARRMFERSIEAEAAPAALSNLGTVDYYEGDYEAAAERYRQAISLRDRDYLYWRNLGDAYRQIEGRGEDARLAFEKSRELAMEERRVNPSDVGVLHNSAFIAAVLGHDEEALSLVDRVEGSTGDDSDMMVSLAQTLEELGERERALGWILRAVSAGYSVKIIQGEPQLAALRDDPRFRAAVEDIGAARDGAR